MHTILVTGGAGFIGGTFVRQAIEQPDVRIVNLDQLTYAGNLESLNSLRGHPRYFFVQGNIGDKTLVRSLLERHRVTSIINFAAESHVDRSIGYPAMFVRTNVLGTFELLEAALDYWESLTDEPRDQFRFLHVSTDEVYGSLGTTGKFTEETPYAPNSPYSASKAASDHFARAFHHTYGLPVLITNCSNNYGPYQFPEKLIPLTIVNALEGKPLPVYGQGTNIRDWLHVEDHCRALWTVLERGAAGAVYNIGGGCELTNLEVVHRVCDAIDRMAPGLPHAPARDLIRFVKDRAGHDYRYAIDYSKIEEELGWRPQIDFDAGIEQTVRWYIDNRPWAQKLAAKNRLPERPKLRIQDWGSAQEVVSNSQRLPEWTDGEIAGVVLKSLQRHEDRRGWLVELYREDEIAADNHPVMAYVSQTMPGISRGPHEHVDQADYFAFMGPGDFRIYLWDSRVDSPTFGHRMVRIVGKSNPATVIVPPGVVHAYKNIGGQPGWVFNAPNRLYGGVGKKEPVDEIRHEELTSTPYAMEDSALDVIALPADQAAPVSESYAAAGSK